METLAHEINAYCAEFKFFWAAGLIQETLDAWQGNESLLCQDAIVMLNTYRNN